MKKSQFIKLIFAVVAGLLFSLGMCMCLLPEWNLFVPGVFFAGIGGVILAVMGLIEFIKTNKDRAPINWKLVSKISYSVLSSLVLGLGMCLIMIWQLMIVGVIVGIVGIVMLLFLIPMFFGFKNE